MIDASINRHGVDALPHAQRFVLSASITLARREGELRKQLESFPRFVAGTEPEPPAHGALGLSGLADRDRERAVAVGALGLDVLDDHRGIAARVDVLDQRLELAAGVTRLDFDVAALGPEAGDPDLQLDRVAL